MADTMLNDGLILKDFAANMAQQDANRFANVQRRQQIADYEKTQAVETAANAARAQYAAGNYQNARDTAAAGNAWDVWKSVDDTQKAQVAAQATDIGSAAYNLSRLPKGQARADYFNAFVPTLKSHGMTDAEIQQYAHGGFLDNDDALRGYADKAVGIANLWKADQERIKAAYDRETDLMKPVTAADGAVLTRGGDGSYAPVYTPGSKPMQQIVQNEDGSYAYVNIPASAGTSYAPGAGTVTAEQLYTSAIEPQESGGRAGVIGPQTKYGRAQGASQMLPATAAGVARKLDVEWRPDLMTAKTDEGLAYQRKLGIGYAQEALTAAGGDPLKAAMYYHGGPDQSIWGPKTRAYGAQVVQRLAQAPQGPGPRPASNGIEVVNLGGGRSGPLWVDETANINGMQVPGQRNQKTGEFKPIGGAVGKAAVTAKDAASQVTTINQTLNTVDSLLNHPGFNAAVGVPSINPLSGNLAGYIVPGSDASDFRTKAGTLTSQIFLAKIDQMKGLGALTDAEGARLAQSIASLDFKQSEQQYRANLKEIKSYFVVAKQRLLEKQQGGSSQAETRTVNGRTYVRVQGGWRAQ